MQAKWTFPLLFLVVAACGDDTIVKKLDLPPPPTQSVGADEAATRQLFDQIDRNHDGQIDSDELRARVMALDSNGDGLLQSKEAPGIVAAADKNGDGVATRAELATTDWASLIRSYGDGGTALSYDQFTAAGPPVAPDPGLRHEGRDERESIVLPQIPLWRF
ncbi:EF hand [Arboricoccus pini]|uniref:EF hand n=1 Tax=Arboricoccus pini TaxID=1963835 RepID=A0A212S181_9PROT|nr:EF-hand domain-containing protein [Arboricoccus pini]SNB78744.1 EF hand [Arboricoccus pini]